MKRFLLLLALFNLLGLCYSDDIELADGRVLRSAKIVSSDPVNIYVAHAAGVENVSLAICPLDVQARFGYSAEKAAAYQAERERERIETEWKKWAEESQEPKQRPEIIAAVTTLREETVAQVEAELANTRKRTVGDEAFGIKLGTSYDKLAAPVQTLKQTEYHPLASVPSPSRFFMEYKLMVGEGSGRITGIEASGLVGKSDTAIALLSRELTSKYGRNYTKKSGDRYEMKEELVWRDGAMTITLLCDVYIENRREVKVLRKMIYRVPS